VAWGALATVICLACTSSKSDATEPLPYIPIDAGLCMSAAECGDGYVCLFEKGCYGPGVCNNSSSQGCGAPIIVCSCDGVTTQIPCFGSAPGCLSRQPFLHYGACEGGSGDASDDASADAVADDGAAGDGGPDE
jgi:hypothetical protein